MNVRRGKNRATRCILGLADGDGGAGQGHAAGVLQRDVDAVGARLGKPSLQMHFALLRRRDIVAHDGSHLSTAGVRHDGAGGDGEAAEERKGEALKMAADGLPRSVMRFFFPFKNVVAFRVESLMLSLSQAFHQKADVRLGHMGSRHVHDVAFWLALQLERRLCGEQMQSQP